MNVAKKVLTEVQVEESICFADGALAAAGSLRHEPRIG